MSRGISVARILLALVAIATVFAAFLFFYVRPKLKEAGLETPQHKASYVRQMVEMWRAENPTKGCPTFGDLLASKQLDSEADTVDSWGHPFEVRCVDGGGIVLSPGPDGKLGTGDDIAARGAPY